MSLEQYENVRDGVASALRDALPEAFPMTLRDYFAAQAMQALLVASEGGKFEISIHTPAGRLVRPGREAIPEVAYLYADGMLAEREKK